MDETRSGWEPIALPQDQVGFDAGPGYWSGSGKAVWAAILAMVFGGIVLSFGLIAVAEHRLLKLPIYGYLLFALVLLISASLCVGGILLLFRLAIGKYAIIVTSALLVTWGVVGAIISGDITRSPTTTLVIATIFGGIVALSASRTTKRWLAEGRAVRERKRVVRHANG
ncbi:hypothetical protein ACFXHA_25065 [Nocardia sp. NPDC059240]|uniref:hypothetical protein n=1 Tax=Nocardia sp. NPDC059240 TaxID=3346786 RepID=UPI0036B6AA05